MKLLFLHLSDVHVSGPDNLILSRRSKIVDAIRNLEYSLDGVVVIVSGDLTFSGTEDQCLLVMEFLDALKRDLQVCVPSGVEIPVIIVPGNHDCDFTGPTTIRDLVLGTLPTEPGRISDPAVIQACTQVQDSFFQLVHATGGPLLDPGHRLHYQYRLAFGSESILFYCYNTAVTSRLDEKPGTLFCPPAAVKPEAHPALVVSVLHHPYNWLRPEDARPLRRQIEQLSDIVLTGHEHEHSRRVQHVATGEVNEFIEGGVLQDSRDPDASAFNAILVDTASKQRRFCLFSWRDDLYHPTEIGEWEPLQLNHARTKRPFEPTPEMQRLLDDPELTLTHRERGELKLSDIFVGPDLREVSYKGEQTTVLRSAKLIDRVAEIQRVLIVGTDQSGKTSLAKRQFEEWRHRGFVPLLVDCAEVRFTSEDHVYRTLERLAGEQYGPDTQEPYRQLDPSRRVLILDNLDKLRSPKQVRRHLVETLTKFASYVLLFANDLALHIEEIARGSSTPLKRYRIQPFGHVLRSELVQKWFLLAGAESSEEEAVRAMMRVEQALDTILGRNFVPAFPVFILAILQANETATPIDLRASTNGYFYEMFIRSTLAVGEDRQSYDIKTAYLAHLAYQFLVNKWRSASLEQLTAVHQQYQALYDISRPLKQMIDQMTAQHVLVEKDGQFSFKYRYIYYYFVAAYLRDHITEPEARDVISRLSERVYVDENANILLFLAHLSRDPFIIEAMLKEAALVYQEAVPAKLEDDVAFIRGLVTPSLELEYVEKDPNEARREMLAHRDATEDTTGGRDSADELEPAAALLNPIMRLNIAIKSQQILGQILKNFPGSLEGKTKIEIAKECYGLGLRAIGAIFTMIRENEVEILKDIESFINQEHAGLDSKELLNRARHTLGGMAHLIAFGLIKRVSGAVGSPDLTETYEKVLPKDPSVALELIDASIQLDHFAGFPERKALELVKKLETNPFTLAILQHLVVQRFYLFPAEFKLKQRVCARLGISYRTTDSERKLIGPPSESDADSH